MAASAPDPALVYLDAASGERLHPAARAALLAALDQGWADPGRLYGAARQARLLLDAARETVAAVLGARPDEVSFPASGTAAAHLAVLGGLAGRARIGRRLVTTAVEHSCILAAAETHELAGGSVTQVAVDRWGRLDLDALESALRGPGVALASVQSANHEVGTSQPLGAVAQACLRAAVPLHVDAAQSVGRVPVRCDELGAALLSASAHKWGGPAGVGVLVVRTGVRWRSPLPVDERERGRVAGFENVPAVVAAAAALAARNQEMAADGPRLAALTRRLRAERAAANPRRRPSSATLTRRGGSPISSRSPSCTSTARLCSVSWTAPGSPRAAGRAARRTPWPPVTCWQRWGRSPTATCGYSLGRDTTEHDVARLIEVLPAAVERLRAQAGAGVPCDRSRPRLGCGSRPGRARPPLPPPGDRTRSPHRRRSRRWRGRGALRRPGGAAGHPRVVPDAPPGLPGRRALRNGPSAGRPRRPLAARVCLPRAPSWLTGTR